MKNKILFCLLFFYGAIPMTKSQNINWANFKDTAQHHIAYINTGFDYGFVANIGYGYKFNTKRPILTTIDYSFPFGNKLFDDFKTKFGVQSEVFNIKNFSATVKVNGIFRQNENSLARLANFGCEVVASVGYYKPAWYMAVDVGFDKAIVTHLKHSALMREMYPDIKNGWYVPTGGNFSYGIQSGYSFGNNDINLKLGKTATQDFSTTASFPIYLLVGYNRRF